MAVSYLVALEDFRVSLLVCLVDFLKLDDVLVTQLVDDFIHVLLIYVVVVLINLVLVLVVGLNDDRLLLV